MTPSPNGHPRQCHGVSLKLNGGPERCLSPASAVLVLLRECSPQFLQELKLSGISRIQHAMPVVNHDASEYPAT